MSLSDLEIDEQQKRILQEVFSRLVFTTTCDEDKSTLYRLARSEWVKEILEPTGSPGIFVVPIPNNIGGRFSERSPSGDVTSSFARRDIFRLNKGAKDVLSIYKANDPKINPALKVANYLYLLDPDHIIIGVQSYNMKAVASALAQKFPESWGKDETGPFVLTVVGQNMLEKMAKASRGLSAAFILINIEDNSIEPLTLSEYPKLPHCVYKQKNLSEEEEAKRLLFFDEVTKWFGEMKLGELTNDIDSEAAQVRNILDQPFVEVAKTLMKTIARDLSRDERALSDRYQEYLNRVIKGPSLEVTWFEDHEPIALSEIDKLREMFPEEVFAGEPKTKTAIEEEDEHFLRIFAALGRAQNARMHKQGMQEISLYDKGIEELFSKIKDYGKGVQPEDIETIAQNLALLAVHLRLQERKIPLPVFYSALMESETLGEWYKYIGEYFPNEFGIGTREQHSYFQTLLGGKEVIFPILVDVITPLDDVRKKQIPISYWGLANDYLKDLYPDEVLRLFLEAEYKAFISSWDQLDELIQRKLRGKIHRKTQRNCAILRLWDLSTKKGKIEAFRLFGRFNELTSILLREKVAVPGTKASSAGRVSILAKDKGLSCDEIAEKAVENVLGVPAKDIREVLNRCIQRNQHPEFMRAVETFQRNGGIFAISENFGALSIRSGNTIYLDKIFTEILKENMVFRRPKSKVETLLHLFQVSIRHELNYAGDQGGTEINQLIEEVFIVYSELISWDGLRELDATRELLRSWASENGYDTNNLILDEFFNLDGKVLYSKEFLIWLINLVRDNYPEFEDTGDPQELWKELAIEGFKRENLQNEFNQGNWIGAVTNAAVEDANRRGEVVDMLDRSLQGIEHTASSLVNKIITAYQTIGIEDRQVQAALRKALGYKSSTIRALSILSTVTRDSEDVQDMVSTCLSNVRPRETDKVLAALEVIVENHPKAIVPEHIDKIVEFFDWYLRQIKEDRVYVIGGHHTEHVIGEALGPPNTILRRAIALAEKSESMPNGFLSGVSQKLIKEILAKYVRISSEDAAVFNMSISGDKLNNFYALPSKFLIEHIHEDANNSAVGVSSKLMPEAMLRSTLGLLPDTAAGYVRVDPPVGSTLSLREDLREEMTATIGFLANVVHPNKKLVLVDSVRELFERDGIHIPEDLTISQFVRIINGETITPATGRHAVVGKTPTINPDFTFTIRLTNEGGIHWRKARELANIVEQEPSKPNGRDTKVVISKGNLVADLGSILQVQAISAGKGSVVTIEIEGDNAEVIGKEIVKLLGGERPTSAEEMPDAGHRMALAVATGA